MRTVVPPAGYTITYNKSYTQKSTGGKAGSLPPAPMAVPTRRTKRLGWPANPTRGPSRRPRFPRSEEMCGLVNSRRTTAVECEPYDPAAAPKATLHRPLLTAFAGGPDTNLKARIHASHPFLDFRQSPPSCDRRLAEITSKILLNHFLPLIIHPRKIYS